MTTPLYRRVLGERFDRLPPTVRALHDVERPSTWHGEADVERGTTLIARLVGWIARLPPTSRALPLVVTFTPDGSGEQWRRSFGRHVFPTYQSAGDGVILERIGPTTVALKPAAGPDGLTLSVAGLSVFGIPMPAAIWPAVTTREHEVDGRYHFEVEGVLPLAGRLVHYRGWLEPADGAAEPVTSASRT